MLVRLEKVYLSCIFSLEKNICVAIGAIMINGVLACVAALFAKIAYCLERLLYAFCIMMIMMMVMMMMMMKMTMAVVNGNR